MKPYLFRPLLVAALLSGGCSRPPPPTNWTVLVEARRLRGIWRVEAAEVPGLIAGAKAYLEVIRERNRPQEEQTCEAGLILEHWGNYVFQVVGHTEEGRKRIELNCLPLKFAQERVALWREDGQGCYPEPDWRRVYSITHDGGYNFWWAEYDCQEKRFVAFRANASM